MTTFQLKNPVGYKNPPLATRFKPGTSGNPNGRPKQKATLREEMIAELSEAVVVGDGKAATEMSKARAIVKTLVRAAAAGDMRATQVLLNFCAKGLGESEGPAEASSGDSELLKDYVAREIRRRSHESDVTDDADQVDPTNPKKKD